MPEMSLLTIFISHWSTIPHPVRLPPQLQEKNYMRKIIVAAICLLCFDACSNSAGNTNSSAKPTASSDAAASSGPDGNFSMSLDGQAISGKGTDQPLQQVNSAFIYDDGDSAKKLLVNLAAWKNPDDKATHYIRMWTPATSGTWTVTRQSPLHYRYSAYVDYAIGSMSRFNAESFTITITSISANRVTGKFSGHFGLSDDTPSGPKKTVEITDGVFDLPIATSKVRPV
jgi:hypothetical protein